MYTVYGISNCNTVKKALTLLNEQGVAYQFHDYKKKGITAEKLDNWLRQEPWEKLVNRAGTTWRQLSDAEKAEAGSKEGATKLMLQKTSVIKRPLIEDESGTIVALGFSEEAYGEALQK
ncbi:Spx/MgsR family RNA polymerase-binding regulatory protein [Telluribacter humicola]|uniref:Spx/MgsR family RNA polymerase-binding regulatory protein n=1 Tax=Telluribacter humicola TaxID=1720261 RepID=UPI001A969084|nr:Spx/MgsR family RNA polymerase-binding regulatory protein [Telluribacter humicola]